MTRSREQELILLAAAGDRAAAAELVRAHQERLFRFMVRMTGKREVAEDVTQEAFVRALRSLSRFDPQFRFSTWLFTIARRVYWNMGERRRPVVSSGLIAQAPPVAPAWTLANWSTERRDEDTFSDKLLQAALMDLPDQQREIVILFHQQDWPVGLIAQVMGMPKGTVKSHLHRARNRLRTTLEECGWRSDLGAFADVRRGVEPGEVVVTEHARKTKGVDSAGGVRSEGLGGSRPPGGSTPGSILRDGAGKAGLDRKEGGR